MALSSAGSMDDQSTPVSVPSHRGRLEWSCPALSVIV